MTLREADIQAIILIINNDGGQTWLPQEFSSKQQQNEILNTSFTSTSAATPHVAGAVALYKSEHPETTPSDIRSALRSVLVRRRLQHVTVMVMVTLQEIVITNLSHYCTSGRFFFAFAFTN